MTEQAKCCDVCGLTTEWRENDEEWCDVDQYKVKSPTHSLVQHYRLGYERLRAEVAKLTAEVATFDAPVDVTESGRTYPIASAGAWREAYRGADRKLGDSAGRNIELQKRAEAAESELAAIKDKAEATIKDVREEEQEWVGKFVAMRDRAEASEVERDQLRAQLAAIEPAALALTTFLGDEKHTPVFSPAQLRQHGLGAAAHRMEALLLMSADLRAAMEKKPQ